MNKTAQGIASKGRYGDSMLVHMSPDEVAGVASLGGVSVNPSTGLPEMFKFKDFLRIALPVAGSILAPQLLLAQGAGALATGVAAGGGSALGTLLAGGNKEEALQSGLLTGLTAGIGSKMASAKTAAGAGTTGEVAYGGAKFPNEEVLKSGANIQGVATQTAGIQNAASTSSAPLSFGKSFNPATTGGEIAKRTGELFTKENIGSTLGRGAAGVLGAIGSQTPDMVEQERRRKEIALAQPWSPQVSFPGAGFTGSSEYQYFNPNSLYARGGGYIKKMQEGGDTDEAPTLTTPINDTPIGIMDFAPAIVGGNTGYNYMDYVPATTAMGSGEMGAGIPSMGGSAEMYTPPTPPSVADDTATPPVDNAGLMSRKAPEGFMWSAKSTNIAPGVEGQTTYRLAPTKNLSALEMEDLTRRGVLMPYRPEGAKFSDFKPQVASRGSAGGFGGKITSYDDFMARSGRAMQEGGITSLPQTEGQVDGRGDGMEDQVFGDIEGEQEVALSKDEFIVPADVVAGLGNGSSNAGASQLYEMMDRVRMARTGKKTQPREIEAREFLPA